MSLTVHLSLKEMPISIAVIATKIGLSNRIVDHAITSLKEIAILSRIGAKNNATWVIKKSES